MRLFYLQNETGSRIPLNNETGIFFSSPEGLGLDFGDTFADIDNGFFRMVSKKHNQRIIRGKLNFMKDPYKLYNNFINWCMGSKELYFIYKPLETQYYIHVDFESIVKTEINPLGYLEAPIELRYLSPWYIPSPATITMIGSDSVPFFLGTDEIPGSYFGDDSTPTSDVFSGSSSDQYVSDIHPIGHLPPAIRLIVKGECSNPIISLTGNETGIEYGRCAIAYDFNAGDTFELSTMYEDSYVKAINVLGVETDLLPYLDLTTEPFFKVPLTEDCTLTITDSGVLNGQVNGYVYYYYRSV